MRAITEITGFYRRPFSSHSGFFCPKEGPDGRVRATDGVMPDGRQGTRTWVNTGRRLVTFYDAAASSDLFASLSCVPAAKGQPKGGHARRDSSQIRDMTWRLRVNLRIV